MCSPLGMSGPSTATSLPSEVISQLTFIAGTFSTSLSSPNSSMLNSSGELSLTSVLFQAPINPFDPAVRAYSAVLVYRSPSALTPLVVTESFWPSVESCHESRLSRLPSGFLYSVVQLVGLVCLQIAILPEGRA